MASKFAKKTAIDQTDKKLAESSDVYHEARKAYKHGKRLYRFGKFAVNVGRYVVGAAKPLFTFLITPIWGWVVSGVIIFVAIALLKTGVDTNNNTITGIGGATGGVTDDEVMVVLNSCATDPDAAKSSSSTSTNSDSAGESDWTKEGTVANKTARKVFDAWVDKGLSGAAAAGIVGWVNSEGGFGMIGRAEGYYGTDDPKKASVKYGIVPIPSTSKYSVGGGGIYQFTPYTKYAPLGSDDWEDAEKMNAFVGKAISNGDWNASMDMSGKSRTFRQMSEETDPQSATLAWQCYERGDVSVIPKDKKMADAQKAYDMFDGGKYKFDKAKFDKFFGEGTGTNGSSSSSSSKSEANPCNVKKRKGGSGWSADGTGEVNYQAWQAWKPGDLPADLKEYALDPETVGLKYKKAEGWDLNPSGMNNQCTDLSANLMHRLWEKDGKGPVQTAGNGVVVVSNWVATFGGKSTTDPSAGAVFSCTTSSAPGHTGVVSHVFANGDFLIVEQNFTGYSGQFAPGEVYSWNYRYVTKAQIKAESWHFYDPSQLGYEIVSDAKSK